MVYQEVNWSPIDGRETKFKKELWCLDCKVIWAHFFVNPVEARPKEFNASICTDCGKAYTGDQQIKRLLKYWKSLYERYNPVRKESKRKSNKKNHSNRLAHKNKRRATQKNACPTWVNHKDLEIIYRNRPKGCHVDHIIPLSNKDVCGLHVPWNLQYLTAEENMKKGNFFSLDEYRGLDAQS